MRPHSSVPAAVLALLLTGGLAACQGDTFPEDEDIPSVTETIIEGEPDGEAGSE